MYQTKVSCFLSSCLVAGVVCISYATAQSSCLHVPTETLSQALHFEVMALVCRVLCLRLLELEGHAGIPSHGTLMTSVDGCKNNFDWAFIVHTGTTSLEIKP